MSVFENVYLSKYRESEEARHAQQYRISFRTLISYMNTDISSFKWSNVPNLPFFMPERFLFYCPRIAIFKKANEMKDSEEKDTIEFEDVKLLPAYPQGTLLEDGEYSLYTCIAPNGKNYRVKKEDCVIIFNNSLKIPDYPIVQDMANNSSYALCAVNTSLKRALLPPIIGVVTDDQLKKIEEISDPDKLLKTITAIYEEQGYGNGEMKRLPIFDNREVDVLSLWDVYSRYDRMAYRTLGVSTVGIQKNERLTQAESTGEEEMTRYTFFQDKWDNRKDGVEKANKMFGCDIKVEINRDSKTVYESEQDNEAKIKLHEIEASKGSNLPMGGKEKEDVAENE